MVVSGIGVGLTLPTAFAAGTSGLPPQRFATGSAVLSMARQIGLAVGVAVLVAVLGSPADPEATLEAFRRGWYVTAAVAVLAGVVGVAARMPKPATAQPESATESAVARSAGSA
jgi:MFS family permease